MKYRHTWHLLSLLLVAVTISGCLPGEKTLRYLGDADLNYYKDVATQVEYAHVHEPIAEEVQFAEKPRTILDRRKDEIWNLTLAEAIQLALSNNAIIRSRSQFLSSGNSLLNNPDQTASVYDPAIQESGVLFGGRGLESALAAFDTTFTTTMVWGRNETPQNNLFVGGGVGGGRALVRETGTFTSQLSKQFAYGGQLSLNHNWNYNGNNAASNLFPSAYTGLVQAQYRHPLLAGAGTEYTRIAGPITQSFGGLTGVNQGIVIARINNDLTIAEFEASIRNLIKDVEDLYWDLHLAYRLYDTAVTARNSALRTWREAELKRQVGGVRNFQIEDEAQALDRYFQTRADAEAALSGFPEGGEASGIYSAETRLRRLLGLSVNDGRIIRPADEPVVAQFVPDWYASLTEALTQRVELRKQKWNIKSLELQLLAAESLAQPRMDFVSGYQVNALGDRLLSTQNSLSNFRSGYGSLTQGDHTGWNLGFEFTMPLGLRSAHAQVRNVELRLAKARSVLAVQELEISHELADAFQQIAIHYVMAQTNFNRRRAAERRVQLMERKVQAGTQTLDLFLRAQASLADAEVAYYTSLVRYNKAITNIHYRKGTLLAHDNIHLAENEWTPDAYRDALRKAWSRSHAIETDNLHTEPEEFVSQGFIGAVEDIVPEGVMPEELGNADVLNEQKSPVPAVPGSEDAKSDGTDEGSRELLLP